jgi:transcriptional regulator with XRE-family HTH domain
MSEPPSIPSDLNPSQERAAMARAYGYSQDASGRLAGVSARTIRRWEKDEHFVHLKERYQAHAMFEFGVRLEQLLPVVADTLWHLMIFGKESSQIGAMNTLLRYATYNNERIQTKREAALIEDQAAAIELRELEQ